MNPDRPRPQEKKDFAHELFAIAESGNKSMLMQLNIAKNPDLNARNADGMTPLMVAARKGHKNIV
jgi:ankyrin repeat protein